MKNNILFRSGEFWFNEAGFQEKIDHPCEQMEGHDCPICGGYNDALQLALTDSVKFVDQQAIKIKLWKETKPEQGKDFGYEKMISWKPNGQTFSSRELQ